MSFDYKHFILSHLVWVVGVAIALVAFYQWRGEHDARLLAEAQEKASQAVIAQYDQTIKGLQQQIVDNDARAKQQVQQIQEIVKQVKTPQQVVQALPTIAPTLPVAPTVTADQGMFFPKEDVMPLFQQLADGKSCAIQLTTVQKDLVAEQGIVEQKDGIIKEKDKVIDGYKKASGHHGFFGKLWGGVKTVGLLAVGIEVGRHL